MPEGVSSYPKWEGTLRSGPSFPAIAAEEVRRAVDNPWSRAALTLAFAYAVVYVGSLYTLSQSRSTGVHTWDNFVYFLNFLRWAALAIAAVMAGPALLEDARRGALELYLSRAVTRGDYLVGKILAVVGVAWVAMSGPALLYWLASFLIFKEHPTNWAWLAPLGAILYGLMWAVVVAGVGLGLSCVARSSRAATLILIGAVAALDVILSNLLESITKQGEMQVLSPMSDLAQQTSWLFGVKAPFAFPWWWGALVLLGLAVLGWGLVAVRHPRLKGVE